MDDIVLTVINVETEDNIPLSQLGCYISLENVFVDLITPICSEFNQHSVLEITPDSGEDNLAFNVKLMGDMQNLVGSITVPVSQFRHLNNLVDQHGFCYQWLCLNSSNPEAVWCGEEEGLPRILVAYQADQGGNVFYQSPGRLSTASSRAVLADNEEFIRLAEELNGSKIENEEIRQQMSKQQEHIEELNRKLAHAATDRSEITVQLEQQVEMGKKKEQSMNEEKELLLCKIGDLESLLVEQDERVEHCGIVLVDNEKLMQEALGAQKNAEADLEALQTEHSMTIRRVKWSESDNAERVKKLRNNINSLNKKISRQADEMSQKDFEAQQYKKLLEKYQVQGPSGLDKSMASPRAPLSNRRYQNSPNALLNIKAEISATEKQQNMIEDSLDCIETTPDELNLPRQGNLDYMLQSYLKRRPCSIPFLPQKDDLFKFGTKSVRLSANGEILLAKYNGTTMFIEEFIKQYEPEEKTKKIRSARASPGLNQPPRATVSKSPNHKVNFSQNHSTERKSTKLLRKVRSGNNTPRKSARSSSRDINAYMSRSTSKDFKPVLRRYNKAS